MYDPSSFLIEPEASKKRIKSDLDALTNALVNNSIISRKLQIYKCI